MNPSLVWGTILVLLGLSLILKSIFHITVPLVRPFFGCLLVYLGLSVMMDPFNSSPEKKTTIFGRSTLQAQESIKAYNTIFAGSTLDLSHIRPTNPMNLTINTVFGSTDVKLAKDVPTKVTMQAIFARAQLPDQTLVSFGRNVYSTTEHEEPLLTVHINAVFGSVDVYKASVTRDKPTLDT